MKANELMIGDIVGVSGVKPFKVTSIDSEVVEVEEDGISTPFNVKTLEPIPLTKEALEANGWEADTLYSRLYYYDLDIHDRLQVVVSDRGELDKCSKRMTAYSFRLLGIEILYVHQLQHALRLVRLNELADNFKIE